MPETERPEDRQPITIAVPPTRPRPGGADNQTATMKAAGEQQWIRTEVERLQAFRRGEGVELAPEAINCLIEARTLATGAVFRRIARFNDELAGFLTGVRPPKLQGEILNPDGSSAERIIVEVSSPQYTVNEDFQSTQAPIVVGDGNCASHHN